MTEEEFSIAFGFDLGVRVDVWRELDVDEEIERVSASSSSSSSKRKVVARLRIVSWASSMDRRRRDWWATQRRRSGLWPATSCLSLSREIMAMRQGSKEMLWRAMGGMRVFRREAWWERMEADGRVSSGTDMFRRQA